MNRDNALKALARRMRSETERGVTRLLESDRCVEDDYSRLLNDLWLLPMPFENPHLQVSSGRIATLPREDSRPQPESRESLFRSGKAAVDPEDRFHVPCTTR